MDFRLSTLRIIALGLTGILVLSVFLLSAGSIAMAGMAGAGAAVSMLRLESINSISAILISEVPARKIAVGFFKYFFTLVLFFAILFFVWKRYPAFFLPILLGTAVAPAVVFLHTLFNGLLSLFTLARK